MPSKQAGKAVAIVGVSAFNEVRAGAAHRREWLVRGHSIVRGSVYAHALAHPPPGILPVGEAAVTALTVAADASLYGVTSGRRAHLFWMPRPLLIADVGVIEGVKQAADGLALDADGVLFGAARDTGGPIFSYDTETSYVGPYRHRFGPIKLLAAPFKNEGVACLALSHDRKTLAGLGERSGRPFVYDIRRRRMRLLKRVAGDGEAFGRILGAFDDNCFYGSGADGRLFRLSPDGDVTPLDAALPCMRGKADIARATAFARTPAGLLYGGTEEGYLFSFNPAFGQLTSHGRPCGVPDLHALATAPDGSIYGLIGRGKYISHLVRFRPQAAEWQDLGFFEAYGHHRWTGYQVRALTAGAEGQLYAGECDETGHLFIYHPA